MCSATGDLPPGCGPATRVDQVACRRAPDAVWESRWVWLHRLRREFPGWVALFDPFASVWVAVRGRQECVTGATAYELRDRLAARRRSALS